MAFAIWTPPLNPSMQNSGASVQPKLNAAAFGDGYVQRVPDGINYIQRTQGLTWSQVSNDDWNTIEEFLLSVIGGVPFYYTMPGDTTWRIWTCASYKKGDWNGIYWANATATLQVDFTPDPSPPEGSLTSL